MSKESNNQNHNKNRPGQLGDGPDSTTFSEGSQRNEIKKSRTSQRPRPSKTQKEEFKTRD